MVWPTSSTSFASSKPGRPSGLCPLHGEPGMLPEVDNVRLYQTLGVCKAGRIGEGQTALVLFRAPSARKFEMQHSLDISQLFPRFLRTEPSHWVRLIPPPSLLAGYYYDLQMPDSGALYRFLLHLAACESDERSCRLTLEVGEMPRGVDSHVFNASSTSSVLHLEPSGFDEDANWPELDDPFVAKARQIVISCRTRYELQSTSGLPL